MLHLVAFPPDNDERLRQLEAAFAEGDIAVLIGEGTGFASAEALAKLLQAIGSVPVRAVAEASALGTDELSDRVTLIDFAHLVALTEQERTSASWYP
jgi:sulfur relay protein TusB/DsrH